MNNRSVRPPPTGGTVRIGTSMPVPAVLRSLGADPVAVLAEAGFGLELFDDPDNLITYAARGRLMAHCAARTGCQHFGLLVGQQLGLHSLGLAGYLVKTSPDVGTALRSLGRLVNLHVHGAVMPLTMEGHSAMISYLAYQPYVEATEQIGDGAVAALFNCMGTLCGPRWQPAEVWFAHGRPVDTTPFRQFFRAPLRFDAERYALVFSADWLSRASVSADPELFRLLRKETDRLAATHRGDFPEQVRSVLRTALLTGHGTAEQVAALFSMHPRTLGRRLQAFGTNIQKLMDEGRFEIARQMLENTTLDVGQVGAALGYARSSVFIRSFRRWSGTTPAAWRASRGHGV